MLNRNANKTKQQWFILIVAAVVLIFMVVLSGFRQDVDLKETYVFFGTIAAMITGAGIYNRLRG